MPPKSASGLNLVVVIPLSALDPNPKQALAATSGTGGAYLPELRTKPRKY
jgi:hypothetical protein